MIDLFRTAALLLVHAAVATGDAAARPAVQDAPESVAQLLAEERAECDLLVRRGQAQTAIRRLDELLAETPTDADAWAIRAAARLDQADLPGCLEDAERAWSAAGGGPGARPARARALRVWGAAMVAAGRAEEAVERLEAARDTLDLVLDARDAWVLGSAQRAAGRRADAERTFSMGAASGKDQPWDGLLARARCQRSLGQLEAASESLMAAMEASAAAAGEEPDVLAELGDLYFEADREIERAKRRSAAQLYDAALARHATHERALLGLFTLHRYNWQRQRRNAQQFLASALSARPRAVETLLAAASADVDDGLGVSARERLALLETIAPRRREVRTLRASMAAVEGAREECERILADLAAEDPRDATPEREVGRHLLELYRFAEGLPFLKRAVERDPGDWEALTQLGRALANTGDEAAARDALDRAERAAAGRQDAWRDNLRLVLRRIAERHRVRTEAELSFSWEQEGDEVLSAYLVPFYAGARAELARRYGFTPEPTLIEVFRRHKDFSVRSTGFEGFPALGVCFGPVVTAVSPLWEMRGTQSWARTSFHEFTHVVHLGLSHNRCPRWITEGLATWEEVNRNPAWTRNLRRELIDALASGDVIGTREMNRAFRGPRILFGYYQSGLTCQMLIEQHGFPAMVRLLEAFDRGLDLDRALREVFATTPEALDQAFEAWARRHVAGLRVEPRWSADHLQRLALGLARRLPEREADRTAWRDRWITRAFGDWQQGRRVDAQEALRIAREAGPEPPRAALLRGEMALAQGETARAQELYRAALEGGAEDYRARMVLASLARDADDLAECERQLLAAERAFPGWDDEKLSAELQLAELYADTDRADDAMAALERWLRWNAGDHARRREVAAWHLEHGRTERAIALLSEANEVDPFLRGLHREWGDALRTAERFEEALREYGMALRVPPELDAGDQEPYSDADRAELLGLQAACLERLERKEEALAAAREALGLDADCDVARGVVDRLQ